MAEQTLSTEMSALDRVNVKRMTDHILITPVVPVSHITLNLEISNG